MKLRTGRRLGLLLAFVALLPAAGAAELSFALGAPTSEALSWRGMQDAAGGPNAAGGMLYPAPNLLGFLAAVLTHGALLQGAQASQRSQQQQQADLVLEPLKPQLDVFGQRALLQATLAQLSALPGERRLLAAEERANGLPLLELAPAFQLSQDRSTLMLDVVLKLSPAQPGAKGFEGAVRVISSPRQAEDLVALWTADDARALRDESAAMLAHAIGLMLRHPPPSPDAAEPPMRTHRYRLAGRDRFERGQLLGEGHCGRLVIRTLRGTLLSAPSTPSATVALPAVASAASEPVAVVPAVPACESPYAYPA